MSADASAASDAPSSDESTAQDGIVQELSHEEFDPYGTLAVTGSYFLLLLVLYALMYFVEFANRPSIID